MRPRLAKISSKQVDAHGSEHFAWNLMEPIEANRLSSQVSGLREHQDVRTRA